MSRSKEAWADNEGIRLHYLDSGSSDPRLTPLIFIPGALGSADLYESELESFAPRRCVAMSLRGRGNSDAPSSGYALQDHANDIAAVVDAAKLSDFALMAFSMGVPYAIQFCYDSSVPLAGMIIADYPARYRKLRAEWAAQVRESLSADVARPHVVDALVRDSADMELWDKLDRIQCPVLVLRGASEGALLSPELAGRYEEHLLNVEIVEFLESGHELWKPSYEKFVGAIEEFLQGIDGIQSAR